MAKRIDWEKANRAPKPWKSEDIRGSDVELKNGDRTPLIRKDRLAKRADWAMESWLKKLTPAQRKLLES